MNKESNLISWVCSIFTTLTGAMTTEELMRVILLVLGIISGIVSLAYNIYVWYKKAKSDGKITKEEIEEAVGIIKNGVDEIEDEIKKTNKEDN